MNSSSVDKTHEQGQTPSVGSSGWLGVLSIVTFLLYIVIWDIGLLVGAAYVIWWKGASGWWFLPAFILCGMSYKPKHWRELWQSSPNDLDQTRGGQRPAI